MTLTRRRALFGASLIVPAALLAGCATSTSGTTTTVTVDVARITTDGKAIVSMLSAVLLAPSLVVLLGPNYAIAQGALVAAQATMTEIEALTGGSVSVSIDTSKVQSLVTSLLGDAQKILSLVQNVVGKLAGSVATKIANYVAATLALIPLVQLAAGFATARPNVTGMTEAQALAVAGR